MKKNKLGFLLIMCVASMMFVGCNKKEVEVVTGSEIEEENMFGLTESEQNMYAEYAAGVLMKYNAGSNVRVLEGQKLIDQEIKEQAAREQEERRQQLAAEYEANKKNNSNKNENSSSGSSSAGNSVSYINDMSVATGTDAFSIVYDGYEITDTYPNSGDDLFMAMDARDGKVFLVTKFAVTNISGQTENFNMFSKQGKFRLNMNGERYKSQYTLLLDDLSMYKGDVEAGSSMENVLVFEIPEEIAGNINQMELSVTVGDQVSNMLLSGGSVSVTESAQPDELDSDLTEYDSDLIEEEFDTGENTESMEETQEQPEEGGNVTVVGSNRN